MAEENDISDELLARWLSGEMTEAERKEFEKSDAYQTYRAIVDFTPELETSPYNKDVVYQKLKARLPNQPEAKVIRMSRSRWIAIAAGVVLLLGIGSLFFFMNGDVDDTTITVAKGERKEVKLPDNSTVALNANSSISYNKDSWQDVREVELKGEALFSVKKGSPFKVTTGHGTVEVLGTQFNVLDRNDRTEVICFTGKVRVTDSKGKRVILTKGMAARMEKGKLTQDWSPEIKEKPDWQLGYSTFENVPLKDVIEELETQYAVNIRVETKIEGRMYYGAFPHDNLNQALELVFDPMQLKFRKESDKSIVVN